jgi:RNA polymerase sigma factor (TIGR02999 family)
MKDASVTRLLSRVRNGDKDAEASLFELVYDELRKIASRNMRGERGGHLLQTTALVHEAYLRLVRIDDTHFETRNHFFAFAAQTMRRILVDYARANAAVKRGAGFTITSLDEGAVVSPEPSTDIMALDVALERLSAFDSRQAKVVEMRFFAGMKEEEIADVLGISARTVKRDWTMAKAWLYGELQP